MLDYRPEQSPEQLFTLQEVARALRMTYRTVTKRTKGESPSIRTIDIREPGATRPVIRVTATEYRRLLAEAANREEAETQ